MGKKQGVTVKLNTEATPDDVKGYDVVIAAVGASPVVPPIPGLPPPCPPATATGKRTPWAMKWWSSAAGQVGCETALHLAKLGKKVTIIEMQSALAPDASKTHRDEMLVEFDKEPNFIPVVNAKVSAVEPKAVTYEQDGNSITVPCDSVILAAGMRARTQLADSFMGITPEFDEIGDCVRARTVEWATKEGFYAAIRI